MLRLFFLTLFLASSLISFSTIRLVPTNYATIQMALDSCNPGDTVIIEPGIYRENINWPEMASIKLIGQKGRDSTIIVGAADGRVISIHFSSTQLRLDTATQIGGLTISNRLLSTDTLEGGGIYIRDHDIKLSNMIIEKNYVSWSHSDGCGINFRNSHSIVENSIIKNNTINTEDWAHGAGIKVEGGSLKLINCRIDSNQSFSNSWNYGAGLNAESTTLWIENCYFTGNRLDSASSWGYGAGIYLDGSDVEVLNSEIRGNINKGSSRIHGTGIYARGGSYNPSFPNPPYLKLNNVKIIDNKSGNGASWAYGAGIIAYNYLLEMKNALIANNTMDAGPSWINGIGIYYENRDTSIVSRFDNITVANNRRLDSSSTFGLGLYIYEGKVLITNSIFHNPGVGSEIIHLYQFTSDSAEVNYSNIRGGYPGVGNINADPTFLSTNDYRLSDTSQCAGSGIPVTGINYDIDGNTRPLPSNTNPDMGCYEINQRATSLSSFSEKSNQILVYPNPVKIGERIFIESKSIEEIILFDSQGKTIHTELKMNRTEGSYFTTSNLQRGIYFLRLNNEFNQKIIVTD